MLVGTHKIKNRGLLVYWGLNGGKRRECIHSACKRYGQCILDPQAVHVTVAPVEGTESASGENSIKYS